MWRQKLKLRLETSHETRIHRLGHHGPTHGGSFARSRPHGVRPLTQWRAPSAAGRWRQSLRQSGGSRAPSRHHHHHGARHPARGKGTLWGTRRGRRSPRRGQGQGGGGHEFDLARGHARHGLGAARRGRREDALLLVGRRVVDRHVEHEPVELRFGQRVGAFLLDRILRGQHEQRALQRIPDAADRHLIFLHRLEQRGLRLGRRAVDLVGQDDVREDRAADEADLPLARRRVFLDHFRAEDVGRHQVRRELDARELEVEHLRDGVDQQRLRESRHADDQTVAARQQRRQDQFDHVLLTDDQLVELGAYLVTAGFQPFGVRKIVGRVERGSQRLVGRSAVRFEEGGRRLNASARR